MQFHFTEEQEQFREFLRRFFKSTSPTTEVRRVMETDSGFDHDVWYRLSQELSLPGISIPESYGGSGFGVAELGIAAEEMGRALYPSPFFASCVLAAKALEHVGSEAQKLELLPAIASGEKIATLAFMEVNGSPDVSEIQSIAEPGAGGYLVSGTKKFVLDGCSADIILVTANTPEGLSLFKVQGDAAGLTRTNLSAIDQTRKLGVLELANVEAELIGDAGGAEAGLLKTLDVAYITLANESVGGATRLFEDALEYTKLRRQFGRTIASFQAIKHRMTDLLLTVELAKSAAYYAAEAYDTGAAEISMLASLAKAGASEAYLKAGVEAIQFHGGIGFTWENDTHLWFKRAKSTEVFLGDPTWHRARMIALMVQEQAA
jgi:alkylation response protein AidB-like acyl-CoA dehydrogenase